MAEAPFIPLADSFALVPAAGTASAAPAGPAADAAQPGGTDPGAATDPVPNDETLCDILREARVFRARLRDAFDDRLARLLRDLAADVLVRELRLAPADVSALAATLLASYAASEPLRLRLAPGDAAAYPALTLPTVPDPALRPGDAVLELRDGPVDARLGVRLADVLAAEAEQR